MEYFITSWSVSLEASKMYYVMQTSTPSLHRESTDVLPEAVCCCFTRTTLFTKHSMCRCISPYENPYTHKVSYL